MNLFEIVKKAELRAIERPRDWYKTHWRAIMAAMPEGMTYAWVRITHKKKLRAIVPGAFNDTIHSPGDNYFMIKGGVTETFEYEVKE